MCGIYGMVALSGALRWPGCADRLGAPTQSRGPDAHRVVRSPAAVIGVHRLRVVDTRPEADQPLAGDGRVLAVNGEIYNARTLRQVFPHYPWQSHADGEPLLPLLAAGDPAALRAVAGMFALAHWSPDTHTLILARDPAGEKPLFYVRQGSEVWFASSPAGLRQHPQLAQTLDLDAARDFLSLGVVREPRTLTAGLYRVPAGSAIVFTPHETTTVRYAGGEVTRRVVTHDEVARAFDAAVDRQLTSDVPAGVFLSGGLDSALVAHRAAQLRPGLPAFCVGFPEASFDERPHARRIARDLHLPLVEVEAGTTALLKAREQALDLAEPIADPALLPTILLAERTRQDVTVALSGEGADELFGGYPTYGAHRLADLPLVARCMLHAARWLKPGGANRRMPLSYLIRRFAEEAHQPTLERHIAWFGGGLPEPALTHRRTLHVARCTNDDPVDIVMQLDRTLWLRERLLVKLDRATMRVGLEGRLPFLDPSVVALARSAGARAHVGLRGKRLLRAVAQERLPPYILRRIKRGMTVPVGGLLNGALRPDVDRLLAPARLSPLGLVRPDAITRLLAMHRAGRADHSRPLWTLYMFEAWRERHLPN